MYAKFLKSFLPIWTFDHFIFLTVFRWIESILTATDNIRHIFHLWRRSRIFSLNQCFSCCCMLGFFNATPIGFVCLVTQFQHHKKCLLMRLTGFLDQSVLMLYLKKEGMLSSEGTLLPNKWYLKPNSNYCWYISVISRIFREQKYKLSQLVSQFFRSDCWKKLQKHGTFLVLNKYLNEGRWWQKILLMTQSDQWWCAKTLNRAHMVQKCWATASPTIPKLCNWWSTLNLLCIYISREDNPSGSFMNYCIFVLAWQVPSGPNIQG